VMFERPLLAICQLKMERRGVYDRLGGGGNHERDKTGGQAFLSNSGNLFTSCERSSLATITTSGVSTTTRSSTPSSATLRSAPEKTRLRSAPTTIASQSRRFPPASHSPLRSS